MRCRSARRRATPPGTANRSGPEYAGSAAAVYFNYRKTSIYGGSNEIQRNIISQMVLGL